MAKKKKPAGDEESGEEKPKYTCDACGFQTPHLQPFRNHRRMKHGITADDGGTGATTTASQPIPVQPQQPVQAVRTDEALDMRGKLRQKLTQAGITQKQEAILTILEDDPENHEHFWTTLVDARVPKLERELAFRLWFQKSPVRAVEDEDMDEELLDYKPGEARSSGRGDEDEDDWEGEDGEDEDLMLRSQMRMMKRQLRMQQMKQMMRELREDAKLDRMERMQALGMTTVNPATGQPLQPATAQEPLVDYFYAPTGTMMKVTPTQMMAYERMRVELEKAKQGDNAGAAQTASQVRKQHMLPDGNMVSATDEEWSGILMAHKAMETKQSAALLTEQQKREEANRLQQTMNDQRAAFEKQMAEGQRRFDEAQRQYQEQLNRLVTDQNTKRLEEEIKKSQQMAAAALQRDDIEKHVTFQKKLREAGLASTTTEDKKMQLEVEKVGKSLDMVGKKLDNVANKTDKVLEAGIKVMEQKVAHDLRQEQGPPPAQEEYTYGDADEPPPETPPSKEGGDDEGVDTESAESGSQDNGLVG